MPKDQARARDRNRPSSGERRGSKKEQSKKPGPDQKGKKPGQENLAKNGKEDNTKPNPSKGSNAEGAPKSPPAAVRVGRVNLADRWGVLPKELRQKLIHQDFKDYTPEYEAKIRAYLKKIATPKKRR